MNTLHLTVIEFCLDVTDAHHFVGGDHDCSSEIAERSPQTVILVPLEPSVEQNMRTTGRRD
jgi:hypothetical protein